MDYKHILSCWHKLEHFSPALLPKDSSVKRLNDLPLDTSVDGKRSKRKRSSTRSIWVYFL